MSRGKEGRQDGGMGADHFERGSQPAQRLHPETAALRSYADDCTRVYTRTGKRAHLLRPLLSPNSYGAALCGVAPMWPEEQWRGTGSWRETETAASMPLCGYCERRAAAEDEAARQQEARTR